MSLTRFAAQVTLDPSEAKKRLVSALTVAGSVNLAAEMLGISRRTLYRCARTLGVDVGGTLEAKPDTCPRTPVRSTGHMSG